MATGNSKHIDFEKLETELEHAIKADIRYKLENDAKLRAVNQVSNYEEFRKIVKASHLKPLRKQDIAPCNLGNIWNNVAFKNKARQNNKYEEKNLEKIPGKFDTEVHAVSSVTEFNYMWAHVSDRASFLKEIGCHNIRKLFAAEIPSGLLAEIIEALLELQLADEAVFVVELLETLAEIKRFTLSVQFFSSTEKKNCEELIQKLVNFVKASHENSLNISLDRILLLKEKYVI